MLRESDNSYLLIVSSCCTLFSSPAQPVTSPHTTLQDKCSVYDLAPDTAGLSTNLYSKSYLSCVSKIISLVSLKHKFFPTDLICHCF